jgi:hypothetical protein
MSLPIPARISLPTSHTARPRQQAHLDRTAEDMAGRVDPMDPLARTLRLLVEHMAARREAQARMERPTQRRWASLSPPG